MKIEQNLWRLIALQHCFIALSQPMPKSTSEAGSMSWKYVDEDVVELDEESTCYRRRLGDVLRCLDLAVAR